MAAKLTDWERWARDATTGKIVVCEKVRHACERFQDWKRRSAELGIYLDYAEVDAAIHFYRLFRHWKGEWGPSPEHPRGQPFILAPWQQFFVANVVGWKWVANGLRVIRTALLLVGKKNGKSHMIGPLLILLTFFDGEAGAEGYVCAAKKEQTRHVFETVEKMVKSSPDLRRILHTGRNTIYVDEGSRLTAIASDASLEDGANTATAGVDELHRMKNRKLLDVIEGGTAARRQSSVMKTSTAGEYSPESVCYQEYELATKILLGELDIMTSFNLIFELDKGETEDDSDTDDDWTDEANWIKANPNIGISPKIEFLRDECEKAKSNPDKEESFRRLHCNEWVNSVRRGISSKLWKRCGGKLPTDLESLPCYAGLDLAHTQDCSSLVMAFPRESGEVYILGKHWIPEDNIVVRSRRDKVPYAQWRDRGLIEVTSGNTTDFDTIRKDIVALSETYDFKWLAYDPRLATQMATQLDGDGVPMVEFRQSYENYAEPVEEFERLMLSTQLSHGGDRVLRWMSSNLVFRKSPDGYRRPDKERSFERIDGMVAMLQAIAGIHKAEEVDEDPYSAGEGIVI